MFYLLNAILAFWSNPVSFSHVQCIYILVLLLYKKLQLFIDGGGKSMTKTYWNHFGLSVDLRKVTYNLKVPLLNINLSGLF